MNARHHRGRPRRDGTAGAAPAAGQRHHAGLLRVAPRMPGPGPSLLIVHATGFHARVWDEVIRRLPGRHVLALEQRGHGRSQAAPFSGWEVFGKTCRKPASPWAGAGHGHRPQHGCARAGAGRRRAAAVLLATAADRSGDAPTGRIPAAPVPPGTLHPAAGRRTTSRVGTGDGRALRLTAALLGVRPSGPARLLRAWPAAGRQRKRKGSSCAATRPSSQVYPLARNLPGIYACIRAIEVPVTVVRPARRIHRSCPGIPLGIAHLAGTGRRVPPQPRPAYHAHPHDADGRPGLHRRADRAGPRQPGLTPFHARAGVRPIHRCRTLSSRRPPIPFNPRHLLLQARRPAC